MSIWYRGREVEELPAQRVANQRSSGGGVEPKLAVFLRRRPFRCGASASRRLKAPKLRYGWPVPNARWSPYLQPPLTVESKPKSLCKTLGIFSRILFGVLYFFSIFGYGWCWYTFVDLVHHEKKLLY